MVNADVGSLIDGFPVCEPFLVSGPRWFTDLAPHDHRYVHQLFDRAQATGWWPPAPDVDSADDPALVWWVAATNHVVGRLELGASHAAHRFVGLPVLGAPDVGGPVRIPTDALGACLEALEGVRDDIDVDRRLLELAVHLNRIELTISDTGLLSCPPPSIGAFVPMRCTHWTRATYRHLAGLDLYAVLNQELTDWRTLRPGGDVPWDLHAWALAVVSVWGAVAVARSPG